MKPGILNRRIILKAAGVSLAFPLVESGRSRRLASAQATSGVPKRFITFWTPNGTIEDAFFPAPGPSEDEFTLPEIAKPLEKFKKKLLFLRGIDNKVADEYHQGNQHPCGVLSCLSGSAKRMLQVEPDPEEYSAKIKAPPGGDGTTLDHKIAALQPKTGGAPISSLVLGVLTEKGIFNRVSYLNDRTPVAPESDPLRTFEQLFGSADSEDMEQARNRVADRRSVLDTVKAQFGHLKTQVSSEDWLRFESHLTMLREVENQVGSLGSFGAGQAAGCHEPAEPQGGYGPNDFELAPAIARAQVELAAMAAICDLTRVITIQMFNAGNDVQVPWIDSFSVDGNRTDRHGYSHGPENYRQQNIEFDRWNAEQLAVLLQRLEATPEGDGTALDNTVVLWTSEIAKGPHTFDSVPFLLAGSAGGALRTGRSLQYPQVSHNDVLLALYQAFGGEDATFGDPNFSQGPLSNL